MRAEHLELLLQDIPAQELLAYTLQPSWRERRSPRRSRARWQWRGLRACQAGWWSTGDSDRGHLSSPRRPHIGQGLGAAWGATFDQATCPFQYALQSWAGTDAVVATVRAALDGRPDAVVVSLDGRSAYDSIS